MKTHHLKTWPEYFQAVARGDKRFELRKDDRDFRRGDILILQEYDPNEREYTGKELTFRISYILRGGEWLTPGYVALGLRILD